MEQNSQEKTLEMGRGLFLIKYESTSSSDRPPNVRVVVDRGSEDAIDLILPPEADEALLWSPGATLVARANRPGRVRVIVAAREPNGSTSARVNVATLSTDPEGLEQRQALDLSQFRLLGHVAGRGDIEVDADTWVAGPLAPSRIEGIAIKWPNGLRGISLRYAVTVGGPKPISGRFVDAGAFAGTRGRAMPLVGATLEIFGSAASSYQLAVESIFLGSPQMKVMGQRVVLSGPTGREPLVGLRVRIESVNLAGSSGSRSVHDHASERSQLATSASKGSRDKALPAVATARPTGKRSGRVRVFRGSARARQSATAVVGS